jgi:uncharacterized membrane protein YfcA
MMSPLTVVLIAIAALLVGLSKGGLGGPMPVALIAPMLSLVMPVAEAVGIIVPLLIFADMLALRVYWGRWSWAHVRLMLPAGVLGMILGTLSLSWLAGADGTLRLILGVFTLLVITYKLFGQRLLSASYEARAWHDYLGGGGAGFMSALANTGAPAFTAYMLLQNVTPVVFVGTTTLFFSVINALKLPGYLGTGIITLEQLGSILWVMPLVPIGVWLGRKAVLKMSPRLFKWVLLGLLFMAALSLILGAIQ